MSKIKSNPDSGPAAQFLERLATVRPQDAKAFMVDAIAFFLERAEKQAGAFDAETVIEPVCQDVRPMRRIKMLTSVASTTLAVRIVVAADHDLSVEPRYIVSKNLLQSRFVAFLNNRVVAQLFCTPDGQKLKLEVEELLGARDLGNGVVALEKVAFRVHTPLGSA